MNVANSDQHPQVELRKKAKWTSHPAEGSRGPALGFLGGSLLRPTTPLCLIRIGFPSTQVWKHTKDESPRPWTHSKWEGRDPSCVSSPGKAPRCNFGY